MNKDGSDPFGVLGAMGYTPKAKENARAKTRQDQMVEQDKQEGPSHRDLLFKGAKHYVNGKEVKK